jgi:hypothetical protein
MSEQLGWYWRRVRAMSLSEVAERSRRSLVNVADAASFHVGRPVWRARWEPDIDRLLVRDPLSAPVGILTPERAAGLRARFPSEADGLLDRAATVLERRVRFFGYPEVILGSEPDDNDPFTGRRWPNRHAKRIDYRRDDTGDPKWIWELNRCQSLPLLAAAWLVSDDRQYAQAASDRLESWVDAHPPGRGIAWSNGFEAGIRAISLATAVDALRGSEFLDADRLAKALVSLWQHARWIQLDPSLGSSANNHRIGELVGLVVISVMAPELRPSSRWLDDALESLDQEAERQILADGTSVEQAFAYHVFVLDLLLVAVAALDSAGRSLPPALTAALERSGDALWAQLSENEPAPTYGDTDDGRALVVDEGDLRDPRGVAAGIAARLGHAKAARVAGGLDPTAWWLFGAAGADRFARVRPAPEPGSVTLRDGGLTILRRGRRRAMIDHGPHGYLSLAAHAHADALRLDRSATSNSWETPASVATPRGPGCAKRSVEPVSTLPFLLTAPTAPNPADLFCGRGMLRRAFWLQTRRPVSSSPSMTAMSVWTTPYPTGERSSRSARVSRSSSSTAWRPGALITTLSAGPSTLRSTLTSAQATR